jgi:hypothetical protein
VTTPGIRPGPRSVSPLRELAHSVASALTLPNPATTRDELIYLRITRDRARLVLLAMRRILANREIENDPGDVMAALASLRDQIADVRDDTYDHVPEPS